MNFEKIRAGVSTAADVGVFIGFMMVAFQLQQNTVALDVQTKAAMASTYSAAETALIGDEGSTAYALSLTNPAEMSDSQIIQVWAYYGASIQASVTAFQAYQQGVVSRADYLGEVQSLASEYFSTPFSRILWKHSKGGFPPEFGNDVDQAMSRLDGPFLAFESIRRDLAALKPD